MTKEQIWALILLFWIISCGSPEKFAIRKGALTIQPTPAELDVFQRNYQPPEQETIAFLPMGNEAQHFSDVEKASAQVLESMGRFRLLVLSDISINPRHLRNARTAQTELEKVRLAVTTKQPPKFLFFVSDIDLETGTRRFFGKATFENSYKDDQEQMIILAVRFQMADVQTGAVIFEDYLRTQLGASEVGDKGLRQAVIEKTMSTLRQKLEREFYFEGFVTGILDENRVKIDLGRENGIGIGQRLRVIRRSRGAGIPFEIAQLLVGEAHLRRATASVVGIAYSDQPVRLGDTVTRINSKKP